jgi:hypothetical protein
VEVKYGWSVMNTQLHADDDDDDNRNHNNNKNNKKINKSDSSLLASDIV